jgi:hypothetical protein
MVLLSPSRPAPVTTPSSPASTQLSPAEEYTRAALLLIERHALMVNAGTWDEIEQDTMRAVASSRTSAETHAAIYSALMRAVGPMAELIPPSRPSSPGEAPPVSVTVSAGIGRVIVDSADELDLTAASARAAQITEAIDAVRSKVSCGWVIDLQQMMSPNDWGAVAGLAPFLREGPAFRLEDRTHQASQVSVAMGSVFLEGRPVAASPHSVFRNRLRVAVLQSSGTAATGEGLLRGLLRTEGVRTFGGAVGSMPITETFSLSDGTRLVLPVGRVLGDPGQSPRERLSPMKATDTPDTEAVRWLRSECRGS